MQANELAYHCFTDTGPRQETPGSKTKDVVIHNTEGSISITFPWVLLAKSHRSDTRRLKEMPYVQALVSQLKISGV